MTRPALQLVNPETGELVDPGTCPGCKTRDDEIAGHVRTIRSQSAAIGRLERQVDEDPQLHPQRKEITALIDRWREATGHPRAKHSKDRFDVIKARLRDGYTLDQLELAIDGIAAFPYVINGQRVSQGKPSQRHDALSLALKGGENLERFANLGARARNK